MQSRTMDNLSDDGAKRHAPATLRNRDAIADVLAKELPAHGTVVEIASGSGEHALYFAERFADLDWQPSDPDPEALASIEAYSAEYGGKNLQRPIILDACVEGWPLDSAAAIVCINMVHISPWEATIGLFKGAQKMLESGAPLILYGPYFEVDVQTAASNVDFDINLKSRDPRWGIREVQDIDKLAQSAGFQRTKRYPMPANNLMLVYRRI
jgi:hypothetical protein